MLMSMYSGVSGLKAQQKSLDVIANNIANVNTTGYKSQTVSFSDLLSQTISSASGASAASGVGGANAVQIGTGVSVSAVTTNMTTGSPQSTGNTSDAAISGSGFFIVDAGDGTYQFTRAGNFGVDAEGNLTVDGYKVCGWQDYIVAADGSYVYNTDTAVAPINLFIEKIMAPQATTNASISGNLDPSKTAQGDALNDIGSDIDTTDAVTTTLTVYDSLGNSYDVEVKMVKCYVDSADADNPVTSWYWEVSSSDTDLAVSGSGYLLFDGDGNLITDTSSYTGDYNVTSEITLTPDSGSGVASFSVELDFSALKTYTSSTNSGIKVASIDGYEAGELQDFSISTDGTIIGTYSNGKTQSMGIISLAVFANPSGLEKVGNNLYAVSANSGNFTGGVQPGAGGAGSLSSGCLEMSNVDLSEQFSSLMIAQRAYQANSKVITASDEVLQTLIGMVG